MTEIDRVLKLYYTDFDKHIYQLESLRRGVDDKSIFSVLQGRLLRYLTQLEPYVGMEGSKELTSRVIRFLQNDFDCNVEYRYLSGIDRTHLVGILQRQKTALEQSSVIDPAYTRRLLEVIGRYSLNVEDHKKARETLENDSDTVVEAYFSSHAITPEQGSQMRFLLEFSKKSTRDQIRERFLLEILKPGTTIDRVSSLIASLVLEPLDVDTQLQVLLRQVLSLLDVNVATLLHAWKSDCGGYFKPHQLWEHMYELQSMEQETPGLARELQGKFLLNGFRRVGATRLKRQLEAYNQGFCPEIVVVKSAADYNNTLRKDIWLSAWEKAHPDSPVFFYDCRSDKQLLAIFRSLKKRAKEMYGKEYRAHLPKFVIFRAHGSGKEMVVDETAEFAYVINAEDLDKMHIDTYIRSGGMFIAQVCRIGGSKGLLEEVSRMYPDLHFVGSDESVVQMLYQRKDEEDHFRFQGVRTIRYLGGFQRE